MAEKLATKSRLGDEHPAPAGLLEVPGGDSGDRRQVAGDQGQHAGGEERDEARRERGEDCHSCGGVRAHAPESGEMGIWISHEVADGVRGNY